MQRPQKKMAAFQAPSACIEVISADGDEHGDEEGENQPAHETVSHRELHWI